MKHISDYVCILPVYEKHGLSTEITLSIGLPPLVKEHTADNELGVYEIDESVYRIENNYKIQLSSLNKSKNPDPKPIYISDFRKSLDKVQEDRLLSGNSFVGIYYKEEIHTLDDVKEGDIVFINNLFINNGVFNTTVVRVNKIRTNWLTRTVFGEYFLTDVCTGEKSFSDVLESATPGASYSGDIAGICCVYRLKIVDNETIFQPKVRRRVRAISHV